MRKEADFEVTDHIRVYHKDNEKIAQIFAAYGEQIASEVLADEVVEGEPQGYTKEWNINGEVVVLGVLR
jgi:isoleucyl-tRNA synthetase